MTHESISPGRVKLTVRATNHGVTVEQIVRGQVQLECDIGKLKPEVMSIGFSAVMKSTTRPAQTARGDGS